MSKSGYKWIGEWVDKTESVVFPTWRIDCSNGKISNTQVYNRALSATEVLHNYNALKGRFGL